MPHTQLVVAIIPTTQAQRRGPESLETAWSIKWPDCFRLRSMPTSSPVSRSPVGLWPLRGRQLCWSGRDSRIWELGTATGHLSLQGEVRITCEWKDFKHLMKNCRPYELWPAVWPMFLDISTASSSLHPSVSVTLLSWHHSDRPWKAL